MDGRSRDDARTSFQRAPRLAFAARGLAAGTWLETRPVLAGCPAGLGVLGAGGDVSSGGSASHGPSRDRRTHEAAFLERRAVLWFSASGRSPGECESAPLRRPP